LKNFCTVCDGNFCDRVWALNYSLSKNSTDYKLHVLAIDDDAYIKLSNFKNVNNSNIEPYKLEDLINEDPFLAKSRYNKPSHEALNVRGGDIKKAMHMQFIWSLAPYFTWFCMENIDCDSIMYIDADIYFFGNWQDIYKHTSDISVGIVEHRCPYSPMNGKYNVGIVYFKNDFDGYKCLTWWKNCLLFTDNDYNQTHGTCGDQKYLELFETLFNNVASLDPHIGHLAPWNFAYHRYDGEHILWNSKRQKLTYCHFSNFKPNYKNGTYIAAERHGIKNLEDGFIKQIYDEYYKILRSYHA
jgi:hypothetical protein